MGNLSLKGLKAGKKLLLPKLIERTSAGVDRYLDAHSDLRLRKDTLREEMLQELAAANEALNGTNTWSALLGVPCRYYPWFLLPKEYPLMDLRELFLAAIQVVGALRTYSLSIKEPLPMPPMPYHAFRILLEYNWRLSGETKLLTGRSANRTPVDLLNDLL